MEEKPEIHIFLLTCSLILELVVCCLSLYPYHITFLLLLYFFMLARLDSTRLAAAAAADETSQTSFTSNCISTNIIKLKSGIDMPESDLPGFLCC